MVEIIGVRFKSGGKQYYFDPAGLEVQPGQGVIVETSRGLEYGECAQGNTQVEEETVVQPLRPLVRIATEEDEKTVEKNREKEAKAFQICQEKIAAHGLEMKLVNVSASFDGNKIMGPYNKGKGYLPAGALSDGTTTTSYGGGTCQVSSTLYNALLQLPGINILYRRAHGENAAPYLPHGVDAAVGNKTQNLRWRNDYDFPIRVEAHTSGDGALCMLIYRVYDEK